MVWNQCCCWCCCCCCCCNDNIVIDGGSIRHNISFVIGTTATAAATVTAVILRCRIIMIRYYRSIIHRPWQWWEYFHHPFQSNYQPDSTTDHEGQEGKISETASKKRIPIPLQVIRRRSTRSDSNTCYRHHLSQLAQTTSTVGNTSGEPFFWFREYELFSIICIFD